MKLRKVFGNMAMNMDMCSMCMCFVMPLRRPSRRTEGDNARF